MNFCFLCVDEFFFKYFVLLVFLIRCLFEIFLEDECLFLIVKFFLFGLRIIVVVLFDMFFILLMLLLYDIMFIVLEFDCVFRYKFLDLEVIVLIMLYCILFL